MQRKYLTEMVPDDIKALRYITQVQGYRRTRQHIPSSLRIIVVRSKRMISRRIDASLSDFLREN